MFAPTSDLASLDIGAIVLIEFLPDSEAPMP
jgi:hypothetical protein